MCKLSEKDSGKEKGGAAPCSETQSRFRGARDSAATRTARSCPQPMKGQLWARVGPEACLWFSFSWPGPTVSKPICPRSRQLRKEVWSRPYRTGNHMFDWRRLCPSPPASPRTGFETPAAWPGAPRWSLRGSWCLLVPPASGVTTR